MLLRPSGLGFVSDARAIRGAPKAAKAVAVGERAICSGLDFLSLGRKTDAKAARLSKSLEFVLNLRTEH